MNFFPEDIHQASSVFRTFHELHNPGNGPQTDKIDAHSNSPYLMHPFSGYYPFFSFSNIFFVRDNDFVTSIEHLIFSDDSSHSRILHFNFVVVY